MKPVEPPDSHHLSAAFGWLGLGDWREADKDLEKISPASRSHPAVLAVKYEVYARPGGKWDLADEVARELIQFQPDDAQYWIWHAYSTRRMPGGGIPQATDILTRARRLFPDEPLITYNLGCYECQMGDLEAAWSWLEKTFAVGNSKVFKMMALEDHDLEPLWAKIRQM
jgi:Flp pilus assembly protein TadD